jgi:O-antigen ligase
VPAAKRVAARRPPIPTPTHWAALVAPALLAMSPAVIVPGALNRFVFGKLAFATAGVALALLVPSRTRLPKLFAWGVAAASAVLALAALTSAAPYASFFGRAPRYEGVFVIALYAGALVAGARLLGAGSDPRTSRWFGRWLAVATLLIALLAVLEAAGLRPLSTDVSRPGSLLGNASDEGAFGVLAAGVLGALALRSRDVLTAAGAVAAVGIVVLSESRGALAGLIVAALVVGWFAGDRRVRLTLAAVVVAAVGLAFAVPSSRDRLLGQSPLSAHTAHGRSLLWSESLSLVGDHPLLGVGPSRFEVAIQPEHDVRWQRDVGPQDPPDSPHNWLLQAASAGGVLLLALALALAGGVLFLGRRAVRARSDGNALALGALAGVTGYGVALLAHFTSPGPTGLAALLAGALVAVPRQPEAVARRPLRVVAVAAYGVLALVFVFAGVAEIWLRAAILDTARGDYAAADRGFSVVEHLRPWDADVSLVAAHAFAQQALLDAEALPVASVWTGDATVHLGDDPQLLVDKASVAEARGDFPSAVALLSAVLGVDPADPVVLLRRGVVHAEAEDYPAAERDLRRAAEISPRSPDPWTDLAVVYDLQGRAADAARAREQARQLSR